MGSRGGKENTTLEQMGCSLETVHKITVLGYEKHRVLSRASLLHTYDKLYVILPQDETDTVKAEKARVKSRKVAEADDLSDLAIKVCSMANTVSGTYIASSARSNATKDYLNDVLPTPARDDFQAAIDAKFRIKFQAIIIAALERQLKELKGNGRC